MRSIAGHCAMQMEIDVTETRSLGGRRSARGRQNFKPWLSAGGKHIVYLAYFLSSTCCMNSG